LIDYGLTALLANIGYIMPSPVLWLFD